MKQYIGKRKLSALGFEKQGNKFVKKDRTGKRIAYVRIDSKGYVIEHKGVSVDSFGNIRLYRRY